MTNTETPANPLFAPFVPPSETAPAIPFTPAPDVPGKRQRKPRAPKAAKPPKAPKAATQRKPKPPKQPVTPEQVTRPKASQLDLQTLLRACAGLKDEDFAGFDALFNMAAPQRERILTAIGKVFA